MPRDSLSRVVQYLRSAALRMGGPDHTDAQLLGAFVEYRDEIAAEILVRRHGPMVLGVCRRILANETDAEDAFQATFLVLVRKAASIRPRHMLGNWLYGVARQTALRAKVAAAKRWRKEKRMRKVPEPVAAPQANGSDLLAQLDEELSRLPAKYRSAIVLCDLEGKTYKEAARRLGCPDGTLSARLVRGRTMLAKRMKRHGFAISGGALAGIMAEKAAAGCLPPTLAASTIKIVHLSVAASGTATGAVSASVAGLTEGVVKTMLLAKLKITLGLVVAAALIATTTGRVIIATNAAQSAPIAENQAPPAEKPPAKMKTHLVEVQSQVAGIVQFIGTEIRPGEQVPADKLFTVSVGQREKKYCRLGLGSHVKKGDLLARIENPLDRFVGPISEVKVTLGKAYVDLATLQLEAAEDKLVTATRLHENGSIPKVDYRAAKLAVEKLRSDLIEKIEAFRRAKLDEARLQVVSDMHNIRSDVNGVIVGIQIHPGESVKKLETVFLIETAKSDGKIETGVPDKK